MTLTFEEKDILFNSLPTQYSVKDVKGNVFSLDVSIFQSGQMQKIVYPAVIISWTRQGEERGDYAPYPRGRTAEEETIDSNVNTPIKSDVATVTNPVEFTITLVDNLISSIDIWTGKEGSTDSTLFVSLIRNIDSSIVKRTITHNASVIDRGWTNIPIHAYVYPSEDYTVKIEASETTASEKGINIYQDSSDDYLYRVNRSLEKEVYGGPRYTTIGFAIYAKDKKASDEPVSTEYASGSSATNAIVRKLQETIFSTWEDLVKLRITETSPSINRSVEEAGEWIYARQFDVTVVYEMQWTKEEVALKSVDTTVELQE